jgi:hypothetical protein
MTWLLIAYLIATYTGGFFLYLSMGSYSKSPDAVDLFFDGLLFVLSPVVVPAAAVVGLLVFLEALVRGDKP